MNYEVDEYGYLSQYRIMLVNTSKTGIPSKLIYIDNYKGAAPPRKEFIPHTKESICNVFWGKGEEFEEDILEKYCNYNLRALSIYSKNSLDIQNETAMDIILQTLKKK